MFGLAAFFGNAAAQDITPTPSPSPTATIAPENVPGVPAIAPGYRSDDRSLPDLGRVGVDLLQQRPLTLHDAIETALVNNRDIEVTRKTETMAEFDLRAARGFYQPRLTGQSYYERSTTPNVSIFTNSPKTTQGSFVGNAGLQANLPSHGTVFSGAFNNTRLTSDNQISLLSPQLNSSLSFSVTQPLLRGRAFDLPRHNIEIAKRSIELTDTQFRQRSMDVVTNVQRAYWDLTFALRNLQVQQDAVRDARSQLEHNRRLVNEGQLAPIDIVAAETQVANFEQAVYDALNTVNTAENVLKNLMAPNRNDPLWSEALTPVEPVDVPVPNPAPSDAVTTAVENRPELEINGKQKEINSIDQRLYRDQKKPQFDLIASYGSAGVGGSLNPSFVNPLTRSICANPMDPLCIAAMAQQQATLQQLGGSGTAFTDIFANKYPVFKLGFQFNIPLFGRDRTASAQLGRSQVEAERLDVQREQLEQNIQVEVRNALQAVRTGEARLRSAAIARENTAKQYESEQRKLDNGQSDVYRVLERQTALAAAQSNELRARTELNKAIADLQHAMGRTLAENGVEVVRK
jgi:HAE1 family hydrophobic/amphiphilic exporter-1